MAVKPKAKFAIGAGIILAALAWLSWVGVTESKTYYHTIDELPKLKASDLRHRMRIGGNVRTGSIKRLPGRVDFVLEENGNPLPVSYVGRDPLPDTFVDGSQALVEGRQMPDGRFVAEQVQAKCASKYEASPGQEKSSPSAPGKTTQSSPGTAVPNKS
jgi:cytochrome c-type biogenesis protein CcmE